MSSEHTPHETFRVVLKTVAAAIPLGTLAGFLTGLFLSWRTGDFQKDLFFVAADRIYLWSSLGLVAAAVLGHPAGLIRSRFRKSRETLSVKKLLLVPSLAAVLLLVVVLTPSLMDRLRTRAFSDEESFPLLVISVDTLRADHLGVYGYPEAASTAMDLLGRRGKVLPSVYSVSSWTLPSHMSMMTLLDPPDHSVMDETRQLPLSVVTLAEQFRNRGYRTYGLVSHIYLSPAFGFARGFEKPWGRFEYHPGWKANQVSGRALEILDRVRNDNFFMFLHYFDPHWPYQAPSTHGERFSRDLEGSFDGSLAGLLPYFDAETPMPERELRRALALYDSEIAFADGEIERLFVGMQSMGIFDKTAIILTSDHGEEFRDHDSMGHGITLYREQLHVPFIYKPSSMNTERAGVDHGPQSILSALRQTLPQGVARTTGTNAFQISGSTTRLGSARFSFIDGEDGDSSSARLFHYVEGFKVEATLGDKKKRTRNWSEALFDLNSDPAEQINLIMNEPEASNRFRKRAQKLQAFWKDRSSNLNVPSALTEAERERLRALGYIGP